MIDITVNDILAMRDALDKADVPRQGREMHYINEDGEYAVLKSPNTSKCWTVTKRNINESK